ncbi:MAG: CoA-binding protein, partial [Alphaproteobacteria bacterium]
MNNDKVDALLNPSNVVLVGASDRARHWSGRVWNNLKRFDFPHPVYPVNPNREEIWGAACYPALDALPEAPDHVIFFVPADVSLDLLETAAALGARSATIYAAGFGEGDEARGRERERRLRQVIADTGIAISGPNCMGNVAGKARLVTLADDSLARVGPGPVAVVTQSGAMCLMINRTLADRGLEAGYLITCGNQTGTNTADYIRYFAADPDVKVILSYLELVVDRESYLDACRAAGDAGKPVITVKAGASEAGRAAAMAHTGSLVGSIQAFDAVTAETGVIRLDAIEDAIEAVEYFTHRSAPKGGRVFVMTNSGALKGLVADATSRLSIALPAPEAATVDKLREILGDRPGLENPLDSMGTLTTERYVACLEALAGDANFDMLLIGEEFPQIEGIQRKIDNLNAIENWAQAADKPVVLFTALVEGASDYARQFRKTLAHLPILQETDKTLRVVKAITEFATRPQLAPVKPGRSTPLAVLEDSKGAKALDEVASRGVLKAY